MSRQWTVEELIAMISEYIEADQMLDGATQKLRDANDRADVLYRQYVEMNIGSRKDLTPAEQELMQRRRENLADCLRLADEHSVIRRRVQAARRALDMVYM